MSTIPNRIASVFQQLRHASVAYLLPLLMSLAISARVHALDFTYTISNNTVTITGYTGSGGAVTIPPTINGRSITSIDPFAFYNKVSLTSVTIPASVTSIGNNAFDYCTSLTAIMVNAANTAYSSLDGVLYNKLKTTLIQCPGGKTGSITILANVTSIGNGAFQFCSKLTAIEVDAANSVYASLGGVLFDKGLTTLIQYPQGKTSSGYTIPASVTNIGGNAFMDCSGLISIMVATANPNYSSLDGVLFNKLQTLLIEYPPGKGGPYTIPSGVTSIGSSAFSSCSGLTSVTIPANVTSIGSSAFSSCSGLTSVTIPASVTSIGVYAFGWCSGLRTQSVDAANPNYSSVDGVLYDKPKTMLIQCPGGKAGIFTLPPSVTSIQAHAFRECGQLTGVTIPSGVTSIGLAAFADCSRLASITIPASVTSIGQAAFIGPTAIMIESANPNYSSADGVLFDKQKTLLIQCPSSKGGAYSVPGSVTSIGDQAFSYCCGLTSVTIPSSVTSIGYNVFDNCTGLLGATFLGNAPTMSSGVFSNNTSLTTIYYINGKTGFTTPTWQGGPPVVQLAVSQEIVVSGGAGTALTDGGVGIDFGNVYPGASLVRTFTILNAGLLNLTGLAITKDGTHAADFAVGPLDTTLLAPGASTSFTVTFAPAALGTRSAAIHIASNDANENPFDISLTGNGLDPNLNVAGGIDLPGTSITPGGQAPWVWQSTTTHDGSSAAQSGAISNNQSSAFTLTATGPGTVSFWWKVSSEYCGFLRFSIDGVEQNGNISGEVDWQQKSYSLTAGSHTLQWSYTKDFFGSFGADCGWVDQVLLPAVTDSPVAAWLLANGFAASTNLQSDPNGDGVSLLMAYALNLDPKLNLRASLPKLVMAGNQLRMAYYAGRADVTYTVEASADLKSWSPTGVMVSAPDANNNRTASIPLSGPSRFLRLAVATP